MMSGRDHKNPFNTDEGNVSSVLKLRLSADQWMLLLMILNIFALVAGIYVAAWAPGGHVSEVEKESWPRVAVSEKVLRVNHREVSAWGNPENGDAEWTSVDTEHYHMLNSSLGMGRLCSVLTNDVLAREAVYSSDLASKVISPDLKENILIPRPTPELNTAKCSELTPMGDHFVFHGKTVAILTRMAT